MNRQSFGFYAALNIWAESYEDFTKAERALEDANTELEHCFGSTAFPAVVGELESKYESARIAYKEMKRIEKKNYLLLRSCGSEMKGVSQKEARERYAQYESVAVQDKSSVRQAVRELTDYNRLPKDEFDPDISIAVEKELTCARDKYRKSHRLALEYRKLLRTF